LVVFAFTTIVSWAHFAERCFEYLGGRNLFGYRVAFCGVTFLGPFFPVATVWALGDVLVGLTIIFHLVPLAYITFRQLPTLRRDIEEYEDSLSPETILETEVPHPKPRWPGRPDP
jgi:AGCS family alanine or glycine:cation symporter